MSFPGYIRSLNLVNKVNDRPNHASKIIGVAIGDRAIEARNGSLNDVVDNGVNHDESRSTVEDGSVVDERGNEPTKSLWVGNIPPRTTSSELRAVFSRFGTIVSTKPQAKYAFVNFELLDSAIMAWRQCHDRDVFNTGYSTINIRFTSSLAEAKQIKDEHVRKAPPMARADVVQRPSVQTTETQDNQSIKHLPNGTAWPNGKPPTGPRSHRREISPPLLRRGDNYRPAEITRLSSCRSDQDSTRVESGEAERGRIYLRQTDQYYSPSHSPSRSHSCDNPSLSPTTPRRRPSHADDSPFPWERKKVIPQICQPDKMPESRLGTGIDKVVDTFASAIRFEEGSDGARTHTATQAYYVESPPSIRLRTPEIELDDYDPEFFRVSRRASMEASEAISRPGLGGLAQKHSKSPSLRHVERLRTCDYDLRASSVPSEVATSSSKTSTKKRRCNDCKKSASDLSPLHSCSTCVRRFHAGCGNPKPSSCTEKSKFMCGRCLREPAKHSATVVDPVAVAVPTNTQGKLTAGFIEKVHLISPPLSLSHDGNGSVNLSPRDGMVSVLSNEYRLESFFPTRARDTIPSMEMTNTASEVTPRLSRTSKSGQSSTSIYASIQSDPISLTSPDQEGYTTSNKKQIYKSVTCKWWAVGRCTQDEDGCYYAHKLTSITFPDRKRVNKHWTCYGWLHDECNSSERDCLYAHYNTGLHVWRDGRPSFKHVTCHWWVSRRCKWDAESCKFAHEDTGIYSGDPADIFLGGSKFTIANPSESPVQSNPSWRYTGRSSQAEDRLSRNTASPRTERKQKIPKQPARTSSTDSSGRPYLTLNTFHQSSATLDHSHPAQDTRKFSNSIGALPQTPNEESPSKAGSWEFSFGLKPVDSAHKVPNLPTAANEEVANAEQCVAGNKTVSHAKPTAHAMIRGGGEQGTAIQPMDTRSSKLRYFGRSYLSPDRGFSRTNSDPATINAESTSSKSNIVVRDPRLYRQEVHCDLGEVQVGGDNISVAASSEYSPREGQTTFEANKSPTLDGENSNRRGVRKCQVCCKPIFGTAVCRVCSGQKRNSSLEIPSSDLSQLAIVHPATNELQELDGGIFTNIARTDIARSTQPKSQPVPRNSLKRSSSSSNIFMKNKRPRASTTLGSSSFTRPDMYSNQTHERQLGLNSTSVGNRQQPETLEYLILQARRENTQKDNSVDANAIMSESPVEEIENGSTALDNTELQLNGKDAPSKLDQRDIHSSSNYEDLTQSGAHLFSSPQDSSKTPHMTSAHPHLSLPDATGQPPDNHNRTTVGDISKRMSSREPSVLLSQQRKPSDVVSADPEPTKLRRETMSTTPSKAPIVIFRPTPTSTNKVSPHTPVQNTVAYPSKLVRSLPFTCARCRKHHKKCLHDENGALSAVKCRDYILARNGKPDSGRARHEWNAIIEASELDPDSDEEDGDLDDEHSASDEDLASSETDDDFATAPDSEEVPITEVQQGEASRQSVAKLIPRVDVPLRKSTMSIIDFTIKDERQSWSAQAELQKRLELQNRGVMFESESSDEDYIDDDYKPPVRRGVIHDPLHVTPMVSKDLFEVAPELDHNKVLLKLETQILRPLRLPRKEEWNGLLGQRLERQRVEFCNSHWEVNRQRSEVMVTALVERILPPRNPIDRFAVGSVQLREEKMTFSEFLGTPKRPEICLMSDGERLAFHDGQKELSLGHPYHSSDRVLSRPTTDDEKWPIRPK